MVLINPSDQITPFTGYQPKSQDLNVILLNYSDPHCAAYVEVDKLEHALVWEFPISGASKFVM
jgi:hypothetical protein